MKRMGPKRKGLKHRTGGRSVKRGCVDYGKERKWASQLA